MIRGKILAVPAGCFWTVIAVCLIGIVIGSFCDFDIGMAIAGKTDLGMFLPRSVPSWLMLFFRQAELVFSQGLERKVNLLNLWVGCL